METSRKYQVSPYDPNFSSAARYSPPFSAANSTPAYNNVIFVQTPEAPDGNLLGVMGSEAGLQQRLIDPAQTYILSSTSTRVLNTYVRAASEPGQAEGHYANHPNAGQMGGEMAVAPGQEAYHMPVTSCGETYMDTKPQIILHRDTTGRFYQEVPNGMLQAHEEGAGNVVELVSGLQDIAPDPMNNYEQQYNGYDASGCLVDQNDGMMVVNNAERIELLVNNELSDYGYKNQNTNIMVNQSGSNYSMVEQPGMLQQQNHVEKHPSQERLFLHSSMSPLLAAVNDITSREEPHLLPDFLLQQHQMSGSATNVKAGDQEASYDSNHNGSDSVSMDIDLNDGKILLDFANSQERDLSYKNNLKIVSVSSLSDEYVDINDVKSINEKYCVFSGDEKYQQEDSFSAKSSLRKSQRKIQKDGCLLVADKHVPCRAWASLPTSYLYIAKSPKYPTEYSVFSKKDIPLRTKFGPFEGDLREVGEEEVRHLKADSPKHYPLLLIDGKMVLETGNENTSNWMRFVRFADDFKQQNLLLFESEGKLFFKSCQFIRSKQELKVGYSREYAEKYGLSVLIPDSKQENTWPCFECDDKFPNSEALQDHLNQHDDVCDEKKSVQKKRKKPLGGNKVACPVCLKLFLRSSLRLRQHMQTHSGHPLAEKSLSDCGNNKIDRGRRIDGIKETLKEDSKQFLNNKENKDTFHKFKCSTCPKSFPTAERLARHNLVHGSNESRPLRCSHCPKRFVTSSALAVHVKMHLNPKRLIVCPMCTEAFKHGLVFKLHVRSHLENGVYTCKFCQKKFKEYKIIRKHIRTFHSATKHPCQQCGKQFPTLSKLQMHLLRHSDHREFLCSECGKQFKRKDKLREHMKRSHSDEAKAKKEKMVERSPANDSPVDGQNCKEEMSEGEAAKNNGEESPKKKFSPKVSPNDYQRFIYKCHDCLVGFKRRGMLVNHLAKRHPMVPIDSVPELNLPILKDQKFYYCQYCEKVYKSNSKRKAHILKNHPGLELPMSSRIKGSCPDVGGFSNLTYSQTVGSITTHPQGCAWCHKQYASKAKLLQHQRKKHPEHIKEIELSAHSASIIIHKSDQQVSFDSPTGFENNNSQFDDQLAVVSDTVDYENYSPDGGNYLAASEESKLIKICPYDAELVEQKDVGSLSKIDVSLKVVGGEFVGDASSAGSGDSNGDLSRLPELFEEIEYMQMKPVILATDIEQMPPINGRHKLNSTSGYSQSAG
ncbi:PR domain zinc finger protein 10-like isoform X2 [Phlebotomus argentipes]|uniref:PR domain zinc finger protein 10-like isoform X2 n=1 Tax=Phlebotomus argentipes TaxID=94469 RepID=UPI00289354DD|nr:PR domain zinc finger protein 10-like isoform X2 [Phlebotomus argentipes]